MGGANARDEKDSEAFHGVWARLNELMAERASLAAETRQTKVEHSTLATSVLERKVDVVTRNEALCDAVRAMQSLGNLVATGKVSANTAEVRDSERMNAMSELQAFTKRLNQTVGGERACVEELVRAESIRVRWVTSATLSKSEGTISEETCNVPDNFPVKACSDASSSSVRAHLIMFWYSSLYDLSFLPFLSKCC